MKSGKNKKKKIYKPKNFEIYDNIFYILETILIFFFFAEISSKKIAIAFWILLIFILLSIAFLIFERKVPTLAKKAAQNVKLIIILTISIALIFFAIGAYQENKSKQKNNINIINDMFGITDKYKNVNYIMDSLITNNHFLKNKYSSIVVHEATDGTIRSEVVDDDNSNTSLSAEFNLNEELTSLLITYNEKNSNSCNDVYEIMASNIIGLNDQEKSQIKDIINSSSETDTTIVGNYKIGKVISRSFSVFVIDSSKFSNLVQNEK